MVSRPSTANYSFDGFPTMAELARGLTALGRTIDSFKVDASTAACRLEAALGPPLDAPEQPRDRERLCAWLTDCPRLRGGDCAC